MVIPVLLFMAMLSHSQFIHKIKADSVLITNDSCNASLIKGSNGRIGTSPEFYQAIVTGKQPTDCG